MSASVATTPAEPPSVLELAQTSNISEGPTVGSSTVHGLDFWVENFRKYEATLQEVTAASAGTKFKAELTTIEQWYKVLPEAERTASVYTLLQHSSQDQIRFYISVLQQMIRPEVIKPEVIAEEGVSEPPKPKQGARNIRPPSLNLPLPGSPTTPTATPVTAKDPFASASLNQTQPQHPLAGLPQVPQGAEESGKGTDSAGITGLPGLGMMSPYHLNMIANAGLSPEAQLLAVQLVMSGLVQPATPQSSKPLHASGKKPPHLGDLKSWRTPTSAKYPASALRTAGLRAATLKNASLKSAGLQSAGLQSAGLESAGLKSSGLDSGSSTGTPREEDFNPEMLNDIPTWLRSVRLHKYTSCFDGLTWQEMVVLDDVALEARGVVALGARGRLLRTFEHARKKTGMEPADTTTPTLHSLDTAQLSSSEASATAPHSAAPTSKLSITSPIFVPSYERVPHSAAATVSFTQPATSTTD